MAAPAAARNLRRAGRGTGGDGTYRDEAEIAWIRRRSAVATRGVLAAAAVAGTVAVLALEPYLALLPAAFILGWLNLVGL